MQPAQKYHIYIKSRYIQTKNTNRINSVCNWGLNDGHFGKLSIIWRNVNFVREPSSSAHFIDNFMLIKNWIGTMLLKLLVYVLKGRVRWTAGFILTPPYKAETINFRGIVSIQYLISIKLSLKWALDETFPTILTSLCIMG